MAVKKLARRTEYVKKRAWFNGIWRASCFLPLHWLFFSPVSWILFSIVHLKVGGSQVKICFSHLNSLWWSYLVLSIQISPNGANSHIIPAWPCPLNSSSSTQLHKNLSPLTLTMSRLKLGFPSLPPCSHLNKWPFCFSRCSSQKPRRHLCYITFPLTLQLPPHPPPTCWCH